MVKTMASKLKLTNEMFEYLKKFERKIVIPGYERGLFGKIQSVATRRGKLDKSNFSNVVRTNFKYGKPFAIDYYGLIKKSSGFLDISSLKRIPLKTSIDAPLVHFASIKIEHISRIDREMLIDFPRFKEAIVNARFNRSKKSN